MILILQFVTGHIIVVPITVQSESIDSNKDKETIEKIDHLNIWEEMIRISINNTLNWYASGFPNRATMLL